MADAFTNYQTSRFATPPVTDIDAELAASAQRMQRAGLAIAGSIAPPAPEELAPPSVRTAKVAYDPTQGKLFIGGYVVDKNNDTDVATMAKFAGQEAPLPEGNWQDVDPNSFTQYVQSIRDPNTLTLMAKNFGMGVDEMQQMAGYGLQWLGAEETGRGIVQAQEADLARNQVYNRNFTDIGATPEQGVLDWMAATIGRLGPNIVESTISAAIGAGIGGAVSGPAAAAGAPIGAVAGFFGKTAVKKMMLEASKKHLMGETLDAAEKKLLISAAATSSAAKEALEKQAKRQVLTAADEAAITSAASANALMDTTRAAGLSRLAPGAFGQYMDEALTGGAVATRGLVNRRARQVGGAVGASFASNVFQQTGAAYGETMADGGPGDRATALAVGIPGALADTIPEFILAGRLFSELGGDVVSAAKKQKSAMDLLKGAASGRTGRIAGYAGAGAAIEGATEGFQEVLQIAANPILDLGSAEASNRIVNAFAAGALMGGTLGGAGGAFAGNLADNKQEANLLLPVSQSDPNYIQYRADLKAKLGEAEYNKVFAPPQPYTQIMEQEAAAARQQAEQGVQATEQASAEADWQRLFGYTPATQMQSFEPPAPPFAAPTGTQPQGEMFPGATMGTAPTAPPVAAPPVAIPSALAQGDLFAPPRPSATLALPPASTVYVPPTGLGQIGPPPTPESDWQRLFGYVPNTENLPPTARTPQGSLLLRGGRGRAPARVPPSPAPEPSADLGGVQGVLQPRREFPATYGVSSATGPVNTQLAEQVARYQRAQQFAQAQQQAAGARAERDYTEATIGQSIELDIDAVVSPDKLGKKLTPNERDRRKIIAGFNTLTLDQQGRILDTFNNDEAQLLGYVRREKPPVVRKQFATLARVRETTFEVAIPKPLKEKANATQPGAGTGSAAPAGKKGSEDRGPSAGDKLRQGAATTGKKPASEAKGPAAGSDQGQAKEDIQPAVELNLSFSRSGFSGDYLKNKQLIGEGSEATVYRSGDKVIKIHEPYYSKEPMTERVDRAMLVNQELGDGSLRLEGFYKSPNGTQNPVFSQNFIDGRAATRSEIASHMQSRGWTLFEKGKYTDTFSKTIDGKELVASDLDGDNVKVTENGKITVIDANISPSPKAKGPAAGGKQVQAKEDIQPAVEVKVGTKQADGTRLVTLPDGRTATIYYDSGSKVWRIERPKGYIPKAQSQPGYISDALGGKLEEAKQNVVETLDRMEAAVAEAKAQNDQKLKKGEGPPSPKAPEVAATSNKTAAEPELTDREVWDETFADDGVGFDKLSDDGKAAWKKLIARKGGFTVADAEELQAQFAPKKTAKELADEVRDKAKALIKAGLDNPNLPVPKNDLEELYFAVAKVRTTDGVDFSAALSSLVSFLGSGYSREAQRAARAYIDANIEEVDVTVAKARLAAANKKAMEADKTRAEAKKAANAMEEESKQGRYMLSTFDLVENPIDENGRPAKGVNPIRVKAIVDNFKRGLAKAPTFHVYKNQADLQRRNPTLYQQAVGSRPQGDFDTARASGFAFDGKVIVFTDRIPTEKYMRLLLAHESIGHFGMRALLPASKFDALMDYVYENNMAVRRAADSKLAGSTDLGARREAVEEYMAKYAEKLDSSVLTRVWNAIKDVLNKLGIKFEDDIVRYLVSQARRTVREGSSMFTPSTFALNVHTITTNNGTGRFSQEPLYTAQHELSNAFHLAAPPPYNLDTARQTLKNYKIDSADKLETFIRNVFRLRNFNALRNHGAKRFEDLKDAMRVAAQTLRNVYNEKLAGLLALSGESRHVVSYALIVSRRIADRRFMLDKELRNSELIVLGDEQPDGTRALDINKPIFERLLKMGTLSRDELNNGAEVTFEEPTEGGKYKKTTVKIPGVKDKLGRDLTQNEYNIYVKTRRDLAELDAERLKGQLQNFIATEEITTKGIRKVLADKNMTDADVSFVKSVVNHAKKLHLDDIEYDERGMPIATPKDAVRMEKYFAAINTAVVKKEFTDDLKAEVRKFYLPKQGRDEDGNIKEPSAEALAEGNKKSEAAIKKIEEFRSRRTEFTGREEQSVVYTLQDRIKEIVLADAAFEKAQMSARRSIGSSHVPLWREGSWQVRVEAQINGKAVKLHPEVQNKLLFSLHTQRSESENAAAVFNGEMKGLEYSGLVYNEENGEYTTQTFKLFAVPSKVVESVASEPSIDIDNFLYTLRVLGQPLAPDKHAKAITMLTAPGSALRKALRFDDTPGYDPLKSVEAIARHVTTRSSLIARTKFQPHMRDLMDLSTDTGKLWFGDAEAVMTAKDNLDKATTDAAKAYWQDKLTTDLYKFVTTNPGAKGWDGSRASFPSQPTKASLGMRDYSDSVKEMEWMQDSSNINESTFEGKQLAAGMKMITSIAFLGGMFTQFAQNLMSPATNVVPYLASKDSQTGFGGGFGMAVMPTYLKAFKDVVGFRGLNPLSDPIKDAEAFDKIASDIKAARDTKNTAKEAELAQQYGLSYYEALNIAREIREGKLIPAQANALLETARGIFTGPISKGFLKFSDFYMSPFNVSEQATRRATFLTAFRLEFDRLVQAGFNEDKASEMARMFAVDTVDKTLGEYSNTNRPPVWRDGWQSLLFVYKTYPLTSLLLFKNLSRAGKIGMLTSLYVLAGAAGFPLVDDMEDLIDTLSQRLGLDLGQGPSVRMAIIRQLEEVFPGWSDLILRGPMNHYTGADVGAKFGLEDFIPGTGILLKGANTTEELKNIAGPVVGMSLSMGKFFYDAARAPLSSTVSFTDVARESPFSLMRAGGDVAAYLQNGAIVDRRGYIVSPEVSAMTMAYRLMGFYPAEAAKQYDFIKYANRMNYDYKEVGVAYKLAWVKAKMTGDERQAARIVREVNDWNEANRGGPGVIRSFLKNAQRALKEARRPAGERFLKSAPVASRASYDRFMEYITGE